MSKSTVNWTVPLPENYQIIWHEMVQKFKPVRMKIHSEKGISFSCSQWNFCSNSGCTEGKHRQLKFLLISGYIILVEGVTDCLEMERRSSYTTYVASKKLHPIKYQNTETSLAVAWEHWISHSLIYILNRLAYVYDINWKWNKL